MGKGTAPGPHQSVPACSPSPSGWANLLDNDSAVPQHAAAAHRLTEIDPGEAGADLAAPRRTNGGAE